MRAPPSSSSRVCRRSGSRSVDTLRQPPRGRRRRAASCPRRRSARGWSATSATPRSRFSSRARCRDSPRPAVRRSPPCSSSGSSSRPSPSPGLRPIRRWSGGPATSCGAKNPPGDRGRHRRRLIALGLRIAADSADVAPRLPGERACLLPHVEAGPSGGGSAASIGTISPAVHRGRAARPWASRSASRRDRGCAAPG